MDRIAACLDIGADAFQLLGTNAADAAKVVDGSESCLVALVEDELGRLGSDARETLEFCGAGVINIDRLAEGGFLLTQGFFRRGSLSRSWPLGCPGLCRWDRFCLFGPVTARASLDHHPGTQPFERRRPDAVDLDQFIDLAEAAVFLAIGFDFAGQVLPYARQLQQ